MGNTKALEDLIGKIAAIKWNGGYDRNGSHDAGEYVDYEGVIGEVLSHDQMHAIAEWVKAQLAERDAQLAAERAMADLLAGTLEFVSAHTQVDAAQKYDRLEKYYAHKATRQTTQDKGE